MKTHKDLDVWNKAMDFVIFLYKKTKDFPKDELYSLTNQMRRAAVSIPSNIAEGASRQSTKEYIQFLYIARGSASELETQLILSKELTYITEEDFTILNQNLVDIAKMLTGLINYLKNKSI